MGRQYLACVILYAFGRLLRSTTPSLVVANCPTTVEHASHSTRPIANSSYSEVITPLEFVVHGLTSLLGAASVLLYTLIKDDGTANLWAGGFGACSVPLSHHFVCSLLCLPIGSLPLNSLTTLCLYTRSLCSCGPVWIRLDNHPPPLLQEKSISSR